ncbi:MAG: peptidoglycan DD-metalloendopeptidase family protein [Tissierellia bacterium]|nr:peptidoglycan DD-metalloendopeptidase family protein [Tissierellia bacterium]
MEFGNKAERKMALALALLMVSSQPVLAENLEDKKAQAQEEKAQVQSNMSGVASKIDQAQAQLPAVQKEIQALDKSINQASVELSQVNEEIYRLQEEIDQVRQELEAEEARLEENKELYGKRLRVMYMASDTGYLEVLLSSQDIESFIGNAKLVSSVINQDQGLIDEIKALIQGIEAKKAELEEKESQLENKRGQVQAKMANLEAANAAKRNYMASLESDIALYEAQYSAMEATSKALDQEIAQYDADMALAAQKEREAAQAAARAEAERAAAQKVQENAVSSSGSTGGSAGVSSGSSNLASADHEPIRAEKSGSLYWPVPGHRRISSPYGMRVHPVTGVTKMHTGIDLPAPTGTPIVAAEAGTVIASRFMNGYGNCVMVSHGKTTTVYAHCSSRAVAVGQRVEAGQTIAYVGSTGMSTGPHLHFEVRVNGSHTNPMNYL